MSSLALLCALAGDVYTYADEQGSTVAGDGLHVRGSLATGGEVFAGVGIGFDGPLDASAYDGIVFEARRAAGSTAYARLKVPDGNTDPDGGVCTDCYNDFGIQFQVTEEWTRYEARFEDLAQETGWGNPRPPAVAAARLHGVQWQVVTAGASFDLEIRNVRFLGCDGSGARPRTRGSSFLRPPGADESDDDGFELAFHGFLRVPMRIGRGTGTHAPPRIPDGSYTDWRYTSVAGGPWTELWFQYGNGTVTASVVLAAYDITDASYRDLLSQLGIDQSFLTFRLPHLEWNVGAFSNRYGTAARYDAGKYDTYLFGATHVAGETVSAWYALTPDITIAADHGIGAKLQVAPQVDGLEAPFLPYPGDVQQGSTLLHHAHVGVGIGTWLTVAAHYLTSWTDDAELATEQDGRITNVGVDAKVIDSPWGDAYLGYSHLRSRNPLRVAGAFEVLHSFEGWNLRDNYFGPDSSGNGTIDTILFEYTYAGLPRWALSAFGMYNRVTPAADKLKYGAEARFAATDWLAADLRYDVVQPDLDDSDLSFHVASPSLVLRSELYSHEEVVIGYSYYLLGDAVAPGYPHETLTPDRHLFRLTAIMWW